jgi:hypothetical protein
MGMAMSGGRARRYLVDAVDNEPLEAPVRRALVANAESIDVLREDHDVELEELRGVVASIKRTVVAGSMTVATSVMASALAVIYFNR